MSFMEIVLVAWVCDSCGIEAVHATDGLPDGWSVMGDGETHWCAVCIGALS